MCLDVREKAANGLKRNRAHKSRTLPEPKINKLLNRRKTQVRVSYSHYNYCTHNVGEFANRYSCGEKPNTTQHTQLTHTTPPKKGLLSALLRRLI